MTFSSALLLLMTSASPAAQVGDSLQPAESERASIKWLTGRPFDDALERSISVTWSEQDLRSGLQRIAETREVAILIDRRIDPSSILSLQIGNRSLIDLLKVVATEVGADIAVLENAVYLGPPATARRLRTVIELVSSKTGGDISATDRRSFELIRRGTLAWNDLTSPTELLLQIAELYGLSISNLAEVPHDLWPAAVLPGAGVEEMLLTVLAQFDLSFEWSDDRSTITLVSMPSDPRLERSFSLKRGTSPELQQQLEQSMPGLKAEVKGRRLVAAGTIEQLEQIQKLLFGHKKSPATRPRGKGTVTYSPRVRNAKLLAFMKTLESQSGFRFEYDEELFQDAGISFETLIDLDLTNATADQMLHAMFDKQRIAFELDEMTVKLLPAPRTP